MRVPAAGASLWGRLAIAFGSRGHGLSRSVAHFELDTMVVHLTRTGGAGALAHEMGHALDAALARQAAAALRLAGESIGGLLSGIFWLWGCDAGKAMNALSEAMGNPSMYRRTGGTPGFEESAEILDRGRKRYWSLPKEKFARAFEVWVHDALAGLGRSNEFLVNGVCGSELASGWSVSADPYPQGSERVRIVSAMGAFVAAVVPLLRPPVE